jgi:cyclin L
MSHMANALATVEQIYKYKSSLSALPPDLQDAVFYQVQLLTQAAGLLLRLPQSVTAQANVLLARALVTSAATASDSASSSSLLLSQHEPSNLSAAALFLTAKLGAHPAPPRDLCNVYAYLTSPSSPLFKSDNDGQQPPDQLDPSSYYLSETAYTHSHDRILAAESRILALLSFDTHVALPHPLAVTYLQALDFLSLPRAAVARRVVEHLNTALLSPQCLYLTHQPHQLAVAAIYNAAKDLGAKMPECAWWEVFDVDREDLGFLVVGMRSLEGWVRKQQSEDAGDFDSTRLITKSTIISQMRKRGLANNGSAGKELDEEDAMMQSMDEMAARIDA